MKKYINMEFDEKGAPIIGAAKDNPTQGMAFVPTAWVPGGGGEEGSGLLSISISPVLETTPALDSVFPMYYGDDRIEESEEDPGTYYAEFGEIYTSSLDDEYTITITPTEDVYLFDDQSETWGEIGEPLVIQVSPLLNKLAVTQGFSRSKSLDGGDFVWMNFEIQKTQ